MDIRKFEIDTRSYPRYSYTSSEVSRFYRRFHHLMTKTELDGSKYPVYTYSNPHIYIVQHQHNNDVDLQPSWLLHKHRQYDVGTPELFTTIDVLHGKNITSTTEKVIIFVTSGTQPIPAWLEEFSLNCIIITKSDHSASNIRDQHSYIVSSSVPIVVMTGTEVESGDLATQIDGVLERIVFRRLNLLLNVLKEVKVIEKKTTITDALTDQLDKHTDNVLIPRTNILQGWVKEIQNGQTEDSELRYVKEALVDAEGVDFTVHGTICVFIHRIGRDISVKVEQFVHNHYLQIPDKVRGLFPVQTELGTVATSVYRNAVNVLANEFLKDQPHDDGDDANVLGKVVDYLRKSGRVGLIQAIKTTASKLVFVTEVDRRIQNIQDVYELSFHRLVWEIKGAYYRSKVPRTEQPDSGNESKTLSPKVARRLFEKVGAVGTGYRCDKLHVYVREHSGIDEHEVNKGVKDVLAEFQITDFRVILSKETVTHFKSVGAKIKVSRTGTLGGFAWMDDNVPGENNGRQLCALMSKHVVNGANDVFWLPDKNGDQIRIGSVIKVETDAHQLTTPYVDVAAALILPTQQQQCDLEFRNSREEPSPCRLYDFTDLKYLEGLTVHLSGATTRLGIGKITIPDYICPGSDPGTVIHYIVVEDIDDPDQPARFSKEGDSGSVICGDTGDGECVDVIAMLIGCINYEETGQPGQYLAFRMTDGLNKLGAETHRPFSLCT